MTPYDIKQCRTLSSRPGSASNVGRRCGDQAIMSHDAPGHDARLQAFIKRARTGRPLFEAAGR